MDSVYAWEEGQPEGWVDGGDTASMYESVRRPWHDCATGGMVSEKIQKMMNSYKYCYEKYQENI